MTRPRAESPLPTVTDLLETVRAIPEPQARALAAEHALEALSAQADELRAVRAAAVLELKDGRTWDEVGALFGVSGSRAHQLAHPARA